MPGVNSSGSSGVGGEGYKLSDPPFNKPSALANKNSSSSSNNDPVQSPTSTAKISFSPSNSIIPPAGAAGAAGVNKGGAMAAAAAKPAQQQQQRPEFLPNKNTMQKQRSDGTELSVPTNRPLHSSTSAAPFMGNPYSPAAKAGPNSRERPHKSAPMIKSAAPPEANAPKSVLQPPQSSSTIANASNNANANCDIPQPLPPPSAAPSIAPSVNAAAAASPHQPLHQVYPNAASAAASSSSSASHHQSRSLSNKRSADLGHSANPSIDRYSARDSSGTRYQQPHHSMGGGGSGYGGGGGGAGSANNHGNHGGGGYNFQRIMDDHFEHYKRPPSRAASREPSVDRMPQALAEARFSGSGAVGGGSRPGSRAARRGQTPSGVGGGSNGELTGRSRSRDPSTHHSSSSAATAAGGGAAVNASPAGGAGAMRYRGPTQEIHNIGAIPKRTESLYMKLAQGDSDSSKVREKRKTCFISRANIAA